MNARFWIHWNDGWCKLTLRPGQEIEFHDGGHTDEGHCFNVNVYRHAGRGVIREVHNDSVDCDGHHSSHAEYCCPLHLLRSVEPCRDYHENAGVLTPDWDRVSASQRDSFAEEMGY